VTEGLTGQKIVASKITHETVRNVKISGPTEKKGTAWNYLKFN